MGKIPKNQSIAITSIPASARMDCERGSGYSPLCTIRVMPALTNIFAQMTQGCKSNINRRPLRTHTHLRRLNDGVLLRMQCAAKLMPLSRGNMQPLPFTAALMSVQWRSPRAHRCSLS